MAVYAKVRRQAKDAKGLSGLRSDDSANAAVLENGDIEVKRLFAFFAPLRYFA
jgi:hypothetical protein